jgi:hypothetical protein
VPRANAPRRIADSLCCRPNQDERTETEPFEGWQIWAVLALHQRNAIPAPLDRSILRGEGRARR